MGTGIIIISFLGTGFTYLSSGILIEELPINTMTVTNKKQFGVWMDTHHATLVGREQLDTGAFVILCHAKNAGKESNSNENAANHGEITATHKFFKELTSHMQNAEEVHVTGTGDIQEQFIHYLSDTPQFKNVVAKESTSNKMSDEKLIEFITQGFH